MKKIAKLSLVAAVAVAGLTTANAKSLEEAIKNVDISGTAAYRYDDRSSDDQSEANLSNNSYKIAVNLKSKINDDLTLNTKTIIGRDNHNIIGSNNGDMAALATDSADQNAAFALSQVNFAYTGFANTTIIAGQQAVPSPFAVQADAAGDEDNGTGITAVVNAGAVTVAATYLNQTNLEAIDGQDVAGLGLMANVGPVALDAWYLNVLESSTADTGHQAYTVGAKAKVDVVSLYARYSAIAHDSTADTESLWKVGAKAKVGIIGFGVDYGQTNDIDNAPVSGASLTGDADAATSMQGWALNLENKDDASLLKLNVNADVMTGINLSANYNIYEGATSNDDAKEYYGQLTHKMGKNFMYYVRLGQVDQDAKTDKGTRGRLHVQYSF
ncbi:porin [Poseidonibacter sp.]|uniref:porin n=1 Tax=Poseidonibacter sp. TaxID=2321188 RepID=UPI003C77E1E1